MIGNEIRSQMTHDSDNYLSYTNITWNGTVYAVYTTKRLWKRKLFQPWLYEFLQWQMDIIYHLTEVNHLYKRKMTREGDENFFELNIIMTWAIQVIQNKINFVRPSNDILQTKQNFALTCRKSRFEKISMARYLLSRTLGSGSCSWRTIFKPVGVWSTVRNNRYWKVYSRVAGGSRKYPQYTSYIYTVPDRQPPLGWIFDREVFYS